jgi:hypothetical protein
LLLADDIKRGIDGCATQVALFLIESGGAGGLAEQAQEDGLENVFGVGGVSGDAIGRAEDHSVVGLENTAKFSGLRNNLVFVNCQLRSCLPWSRH